MRVSTIIIIIIVVLGGLWFANKKGYFKKAEEAADTFEGHYGKGLKHYQKMRYEEAIEEFQIAMEKDPKHAEMPTLLRRLGDSYKDNRQPDKAIETYEKLIAEYPEHKIIPDTKNALEKVKALGRF